MVNQYSSGRTHRPLLLFWGVSLDSYGFVRNSRISKSGRVKKTGGSQRILKASVELILGGMSVGNCPVGRATGKPSCRLENTSRRNQRQSESQMLAAATSRPVGP
jgi:hypothetical protein